MQNTIEIKSTLFPQCAHCPVAESTANDAIIDSKTPSKKNTEPQPADANLHASILCGFDTGVQLPKSQVVYEVKVLNEKNIYVGGGTGPVDSCPGLATPLTKLFRHLILGS